MIYRSFPYLAIPGAASSDTCIGSISLLHQLARLFKLGEHLLDWKSMGLNRRDLNKLFELGHPLETVPGLR